MILSSIYLRNIQDGDAEIIFKWENDPDNWKVSEIKKPFTKEEIEQFVQQEQNIYKNTQLRLMICLTTTKVAIGCVDLFEYNNQKAGVGILIDEEYRNRGFGEQSIQQLKAYCIQKLSIVCLFCNIFKNNLRSIRLFEKCGFCYVDEREWNNKKVNYYELNLY